MKPTREDMVTPGETVLAQPGDLQKLISVLGPPSEVHETPFGTIHLWGNGTRYETRSGILEEGMAP